MLQETQEREKSPDSDYSSLALAAWKLSVAQTPPAFPASGQGCVGHSCTDDLISFLLSKQRYVAGGQGCTLEHKSLLLLGFVPWSNIRPCLRISASDSPLDLPVSVTSSLCSAWGCWDVEQELSQAPERRNKSVKQG